MGLFGFFKKKQKTIVKADSTPDFLEQFSQRKDNHESCRREPHSDEVKVPTDSDLFLKSIGWEKHNHYFNICEKESLAGFNYFIMSKSDYEEVQKIVRENENRDFFLNETARLNNEGIALESEDRIDEAVMTYEDNVKLGYPARHSYDRLIVIYHKRDDKENEERILRIAIEKFPNDGSYKKKLDKLTGQYTEILPTHILPYVETDDTIGQHYFAEILNLREFDFYFEKPDDIDTLTYLNMHRDIASNDELSTLNAIRAQFRDMLEEAASFENEGRLDLASDVYEKMIANECYQTKPYERLIIIYHKAKLYDDEKRILERGIDFFTKLEERQRNYVLDIAPKYGKLEFVNSCIESGKRIQYYYGVFDLYNPYGITEKWKARLSKMK